MDRIDFVTRRNGLLPLTRLGFGGAPLGNLYRAIDEDTAQATLQAAHDGGVRLFDTAPLYGLGLSEERFGRALAHWQRDDMVLSTKIGRVLEDCVPADKTQTIFLDTPDRRFTYDYSYDGVMRSLEGSLHRLGTDRVDILLVHDVDIWTHGSKAASDARIAEVLDGGFRALDDLRGAGTVKAIGVGVNEWEVCEFMAQRADFDLFLLAGRYTLLEQGALDSFLPLCVDRGIGIMLGGPYNSGILATGAVEGARYNYGPASAEILERTRRIEQVCAAHRVALPAAAMAFVLAHPAVTTIIPGALAPSEVHRNIELVSTPIPAGLWSDLKTAGLIRADAPVPGD